MVNKKILIICNFSKGISGTFTRAFEDAKEFVKRGHEVHIFSSNETEERLIVDREVLEGVMIKRFPVSRKIGYALWFLVEEEVLKLRPDIIICHGYRKPYTNKAVKIAKKIEAKCFLITHSPFNVERNWKLRLFTKLYDLFCKNILNKFDKVIAITKWEMPYLSKLGCKKEKIVYIPNGLPNEFFENRKEGNGILFLGRITPLKDLDILDLALENLKIQAIAVGPIEKNYNPNFKNIKINPPIYDLKEKIAEIDKCEIFVLPSKREAMPQALVEAMARGKIVIASETDGANELIEHGKNGFLFPIGDSFRLRTLLIFAKVLQSHQKEMISDEAIKTAERYNINKLIKGWDNLINNGKLEI
jgi:glycosyltransferase involved in cell wall biosynthesis